MNHNNETFPWNDRVNIFHKEQQYQQTVATQKIL